MYQVCIQGLISPERDDLNSNVPSFKHFPIAQVKVERTGKQVSLSRPQKMFAKVRLTLESKSLALFARDCIVLVWEIQRHLPHSAHMLRIVLLKMCAHANPHDLE